MRLKTTASAAFLLLLALAANSQDVSIKEDEKPDELKKQEEVELRKEISLLLVKETAAEIEQLQSLTNRISFSADLAEIAYGLDPTMSRRMYVELSDSLTRFIASQSQLITDKDKNAGVISGYRSASRTVWKLRRAASIRSQAVLSAAKNDPILALDLLDATKLPPEVAETLGYFGGNDNALLMQIAGIVSLDDAETLEEFGDRLLKDGLNAGAPILLSKMIGNKHEGAKSYARRVLSAAGREIDGIDPDLDTVAMFLGVATEIAKKPETAYLDPAEVRNLAEAFGREVLKMELQDLKESGKAAEYASTVRPYSKDVADRIEAKVFGKSGGFGTGSGMGSGVGTYSANPPPPPPPPAVRGDGTATASPINKEGFELQREKEREAELEEKMRSPEDEERAAAAREYVSSALRKVEEIDDPMAKTAAFIAVVSRLEQLGQMEAASEVLTEAFRSISPNPRNFQDYLQTWALAGALVERDPERAFAMIEDLVFKLNGVAASFHGFAEFLDTNGEILDEGELQFGGFGGGMMAQMTRTLDSTGRIIGKLAETDLARTRSLAERFDRPEIRVTARLLILKSFVAEAVTASQDAEPQIMPATDDGDEGVN